MKNKILFLIVLMSFFSCEEVVQIDVPSGEPKLIVDAIFEVYFNETPVTAKTNIKLNLSADYFEDEIPVVTNATVFVTNLSNNSVINYSDENQDGNYISDIDFIPEDDVKYELTIIYNGETYKATNKKIKTPKITDAFQGDKTLFSGEETEIKIFFTDDGTQENFYLFNFDYDLYAPIEDRFFNGSNYGFSFFFQEDEIDLPTDVTIKLSGVTKDFHTYFRVLINQSGQNSGGPFQTTPSSLIGNIVNKTNFKNFPLGYFHISETDKLKVSLVDNN